MPSIKSFMPPPSVRDTLSLRPTVRDTLSLRPRGFYAYAFLTARVARTYLNLELHLIIIITRQLANLSLLLRDHMPWYHHRNSREYVLS
jgi:hypothetical protein